MIKGINIEIGAETTGLQAALKDVDKQSRSIQSELKKVEQLLKLDPTNTDMVAQKQHFLAAGAEKSAEKLQTLRAAQEQVNEQFAKGDITGEQYRAFQREIAKTEQEVQKLDSALEESLRQEFNAFNQELVDMQRELNNTGNAANNLDISQNLVSMQQELNNTSIAARNLDTAVDIQLSNWDRFADACADVERQLHAAGDRMVAIGGSLTKAVTVPVLGVGVALGKTAYEFNQTKESAEIALTTMLGSKEAAKGFMDEVLTFARTTPFAFPDLVTSARNMVAFGMETDKVIPLMNALGNAVAATGGNSTDIAGLTDIMGKIQARGKITNMEINQLAKRGIPALAMFGNQMGITTEEVQDMITKGLIPAEQAFEMLVEGIENGTEGINGSTAKMGGLMTELKSTLSGVTDSLRSTFRNAATEIFEKHAPKIKETMLGIREPISALPALLGPAISTVLGIIMKLGNGLASVATWFKGLSPEMQKTISSLVLFTVAAGPMMTIVGKLIGPIGSLIGIIGKLSAAAAAGASGFGVVTTAFPIVATVVAKLGAAFTVLTGPVGLAIAAVAALGIGAYKLHQHMKQDALPAVERFGAGVSEATKEATNGFLDMEEAARRSFTELTINGEHASDELREAVSGNYSAMADEVIAALDRQKTESEKSLQKMFEQSTVLSEEEKKVILENSNEAYEKKKATIEAANNTIQEILAAANEEKRALSREEAAIIQMNQLIIAQSGIKALTDSEREQRVIMERMVANAGIISADQAAEVVRNSVAQREQVIAEAEQQYNGTLAEIIKQRDELGSISAEQAELLIAEAQRQRDESISAAEEMHQDILAAAQEKAGEHVGLVDWETGELLSRWDILKANASEKYQEIKASAISTWEAQRASWSESWENMKSTLSTKGTEIVTKVGEVASNVLAKFAELPEKVLEIGANIVNGLWNGITSRAEWLYSQVSGFITNIITRAKAGLEEKSPSRVFHRIGENIVLGLGDGINEKAGYAIDQVKRLTEIIGNTGNAISTGILSIDRDTGEVLYSNTYSNIMKRLDLYAKERDKRVSMMTEGTNENIKQIQREIEATKKATDVKIKLYEQEYQARYKLIDDATDDRVKALQSQITAIDKQNEQEARAKAEREYRDKLEGLQDRYHATEGDEAESLWAEIAQLEAEHREKQIQQQRRDQQEQLRDQMAQVREEAAAKKKALEEELEEKRYNLEQQRIEEIDHMNQILELMKEQVKLKEEMEKIQTDIVKKENALQTDIVKKETKLQRDIMEKEQKLQDGKLTDAAREKLESELEELKNVTAKELAELRIQTENELNELKEREAGLAASIDNKQKLLEKFTPELARISDQYGQTFLSGFRSTEGQIKSYISGIVNYMRQQLASVAGEYGGGGYDGSHARGLAYVPYDNYRAILHEGERVLTRTENQEYSEGGGKGETTVNVTQHIYSPTADPREEQRRAAREFKKLALGV